MTNCANNYGPYQHIEKVHSAADHERVDRTRSRGSGAGLNVREWTHVDDHNAAIHLVLEKGRIGRDVSHRLGRRAQQSRGVRTHPRTDGKAGTDWYEHVTDRAGHDLRYAIDPSPLYNELGWGPKHTDFEEGLRATIEWYRDNESWWRPLKDAVEAGYAERGQ